MVTLHHVAFRSRDGNVLLRDISFTLQSGEKTALLGANGSGKTTLAWLLAGAITASDGIIEWTPPLQPAEVQILFQNPASQVLGNTVGEELRVGLQFAGFSESAINEIVADGCAQLGLDEQRELITLSGGELQSVLLYAVRILKPRLTIYDEPAMFLSPRRREGILHEVLTGESAALWITPHLREALRFSRIIVLHRGVLVADIQTAHAPLSELTWSEWGTTSLPEWEWLAKSN